MCAKSPGLSDLVAPGEDSGRRPASGGKMPALPDLIAAEIAQGGPHSFARFIELALYHPQLGYYASGRAKIGRGGDFYTNVSIGPVFGRVLAGQFREMWRHLGQPAGFCLVEQGAHDGQLAADVLSALPDLPLQYWIVEPSASLRELQQETLRGRAVRWAESLEDLPTFDGVHFSNELVDALPFHLVQSTGDTWEELFVVSHQDGFAFRPAAPSPALRDDLREFPSRPAGTIAEVRPVVRGWLGALGKKIRTGWVLVVDYGLSREKLHAPHRREGTFSCYQGHRRDAKPLEDPGNKDITAHVDFTALMAAARENGFRVEGFADQHHFLVGASESLLKSLDGPPDSASQKLLRTLQTLLHPESMGTQFHYLALSKGLAPPHRLSGFRHAREPALS